MGFYDPPPPVIETSAELFVRRRQMSGAKAMEVLKAQFVDGCSDLWKNSDGLTPQQCFDALGAHAAGWWIDGLTTLGLILRGDAQWDYPKIPNKPDTETPWVVTMNQDGTITLS